MKSRRHSARRPMPAALLSIDDLQDPRDFFKRRRHAKSDHKANQLCRQVQQAISLSLAGDWADPLLQSLVVDSVHPAPDASRLMVMLSIASVPSGLFDGAGSPQEAMAQILGKLEAIRPALRREVAAAITRKRAPELAFQLVTAMGGPQ